MITKLFFFDFHISAEQFYDRNKQEWGKKSEINKQYHVKWWLKYQNNRSVSWRLSCNNQFTFITHRQLFWAETKTWKCEKN